MSMVRLYLVKSYGWLIDKQNRIVNKNLESPYLKYYHGRTNKRKMAVRKIKDVSVYGNCI